MLKAVRIARYREDLMREAASLHWRTVHGTLPSKVPGIGRYVQTHVVSGLGPGDPDFDGYGFAWYESLAAYEASLRTPEWQALNADAPALFDARFSAGMAAFIEERVLRDGPPGAVKLAFVLRFRQDLPWDEAAEHWRRKHGDLALRIPGLVRYVQNEVTAPLGPAGIDHGVALRFDGIAELWFEDRAALDAALQSPEWRATGADGAEIFDMPGLWIAFTEEYDILTPAGP